MSQISFPVFLVILVLNVARCVSHNEAWLQITKSQDRLLQKEPEVRSNSTALSGSNSLFLYHPHLADCLVIQGRAAGALPLHHIQAVEEKKRHKRQASKLCHMGPSLKAHSVLMCSHGWHVIWLTHPARRASRCLFTQCIATYRMTLCFWFLHQEGDKVETNSLGNSCSVFNFQTLWS